MNKHEFFSTQNSTVVRKWKILQGLLVEKAERVPVPLNWSVSTTKLTLTSVSKRGNENR